MSAASPGLQRRLGTGDAVVVGLGAMIGAGVFAAFAPAARAAGTGLMIGLGIAAVIAYCNATASAQLAAVYPTSGGTYVYGRRRLGPWFGFAAGWGFVVGKTASCAAMALTVAAYAVPGSAWVGRLVAVAAVVGVAALNYRGITRTAALARVLVAATLVALIILVVGILAAGDVSTTRLGGLPALTSGGVYGIAQSAGLMFFAFAGYARIATLGEEVRDPRRTIPRAIPLALAIVVVIYVLVGITVLLAAGPAGVAATDAPLARAVHAAGVDGLAPVVRVGGALASLGALLALVAGIGRTGLAMARHRDLPAGLRAVHPRYRVPHRAELAVAAIVTVVVLTVDLRSVIGFSSFGVLVYYGIANAAAFTQPAADRRWPRWLNVLGLLGCVGLVITLPWQSVVAGVGMFAVGLTGRLLVLRRRGPEPPADGTGHPTTRRGTVLVRYIVDDVDEALAFYTGNLGFQVAMRPAPTFAMLSRGPLRLALSAPSSQGGGGQPLAGGRQPGPGGWNRFSLSTDDLEADVARLRAAGVRFRSDVIIGVGGNQVLVEDPSGNPVELFQSTR